MIAIKKRERRQWVNLPHLPQQICAVGAGDNHAAVQCVVLSITYRPRAGIDALITNLVVCIENGVSSLPGM